MLWQKAKLSKEMFQPYEVPVFEWVRDHLQKHHTLPQVSTLELNHPEIAGIETPEPVSYYVERLENAYYHQLIDKANVESQGLLKKNQDNHTGAIEVLTSALNTIKMQQYRQRLIDVGQEGPSLILGAYHKMVVSKCHSMFGWDYMDSQGPVVGGDVVSIVGRPATGKSFMSVWLSITNWRVGNNVLFVSMEMGPLPIVQRIASVYTQAGISQLKSSGFSSETYKKFTKTLLGMKTEKANFYVVDGNLAASVEDIYILADQLQCPVIVIDGAYLVRHRNAKLDRFTRAAENVELMKRYTSELDAATYASWQFNREASNKGGKTGKQGGDLDNIGYSDAIGQISSIALGLFQEEGIETMNKRAIRVLKGRDGAVGQYSIAWDFDLMDFRQVDPPIFSSDIEEDSLLYL